MSDGRPAPAHPDAVVQGDTYRFTVLSDRLIRMEWAENGAFVDERTQLVVDRGFDVPPFRVVQLPGGGLEIGTDSLLLRYDGGEFSDAGLTVTLTRGAVDDHYSVWRYGAEYPQMLPHRGNLLGTARTLDLVDGATPLGQGLLATYGFTAIDDSSSALLSADGWIAARPDAGPRGRQDLYLFAHGRDYSAAMADYLRLTGPIPLIPRAALGNWWSRFWPYSEAGYLALMDRFEAERIPLSVAVIDMDWHLAHIDPEIGTGWTGYTWNRELVPDPERFLDELHARGLSVTLNVHPADGVRRHEDAYPAMASAVGIDPDSGLPVPFDITSRTFVDAYLRHLHHPLEEQGVDFWWLDWQSGGSTGIAGLDPLWMLNHLHYLDSGRDGRRPLTFSRYSGLGSHRYPVGFSGDTVISWASLDFQPYFTATAANVAYTWWSHDIGGHMFGTKDAELTVRWFQLGTFSPINRLHSTMSPFMSKEPWTFGPRAHEIMARYLRLRHRLIPALYTAAWQAHTDGVSVVRPMYHDHSAWLEAYRVPNQAMLGEHLLVAPITIPEDAATKLATVTVWLPAGAWYDIVTGRRYAGGRQLTLHRPLEQYPVLARAGAVLPLADSLAPISDAPSSLTLRVYPGDGVSHLIEDHGEGAPTASDRNLTRLVQSLIPVDAGDEVAAFGDATRFRDGVTRYDSGQYDLRLTIEPTTGPNPLVTREVTLEVVGVTGAHAIELNTFSEGAERPTAEGPADEQPVEDGLVDDGPVASAAPESAVTDGTPDTAGLRIAEDEVLSDALRVPLGTIDLTRPVEVLLRGITWAQPDAIADAFAILDAAEIGFLTKDAAWNAVRTLRGLELAQALTTLPDLPHILRDAILERACS